MSKRRACLFAANSHCAALLLNHCVQVYKHERGAVAQLVEQYWQDWKVPGNPSRLGGRRLAAKVLFTVTWRETLSSPSIDMVRRYRLRSEGLDEVRGLRHDFEPTILMLSTIIHVKKLHLTARSTVNIC